MEKSTSGRREGVCEKKIGEIQERWGGRLPWVFHGAIDLGKQRRG